MHCRELIRLLLTGNCFEAITAEEVRVFHFENESLVSYEFDSAKTVWYRNEKASLLNFLSKEYKRFRVADSYFIGGITDRPEEQITVPGMTDRELAYELLNKRYIRFKSSDNDDFVIGIDDKGNFYHEPFKLWNMRFIDDFINDPGSHSSKTPGRPVIRTIVLEHNAFVIRDCLGGNACAYQLNGEQLEYFEYSKERRAWIKLNNKTAYDLLLTPVEKSMNLDFITEFVDESDQHVCEVSEQTNKEQLMMFIKNEHIIYQSVDKLMVIHGGYDGFAEYFNWLPFYGKDRILACSKESLSLITPFDKIKFNLIFNEGIDVSGSTEEQLVERFKYFSENYYDERIEYIFFSCYGLNGCEKLSYRAIGEHLNISTERVRQILKKAFRQLRHPLRKGILSTGEKLFKPEPLKVSTQPRTFEKYDKFQTMKGFDVKFLWLYTGTLAERF